MSVGCLQAAELKRKAAEVQTIKRARTDQEQKALNEQLRALCNPARHVTLNNLLQQGADPNAVGSSGNSAFFESVVDGDLGTVALFIERGARLNDQNAGGRTPLLVASEKGHLEVVRLLLSKEGIDINKPAKNGLTPLIFASWKGHLEIVRVLLSKEGIDVNKPKNEGITSLIIASFQGHLEVVRLLLSKEGVDVNKCAIHGDTAINSASFSGHLEVVKELVAQGADRRILFKGSKTAEDLAREKGHGEIADYLKSLRERDDEMSAANALHALDSQR